MMLVASDQWKWKWETNIVHRHSEESSELYQFSSDGAFVGGIPDVHIILTLTCAYVKTLRRPDSTRRHSPSIMIIDWMPVTDLVNARNDTETDPRRFRCPAAICIGQIWLLRSFLYRIRKKNKRRAERRRWFRQWDSKCYPIIARRFEKETLHVCLDAKVKWYRHLSGANRVKFLDSFNLTRATPLLFCSRFWKNFMARDDEYDYLFKGEIEETPRRRSLSSRRSF